MFRIQIYLIALMIAATVITVISSLTGYATIHAFGYELYWPVGLLIGLCLVFAFGLILVTNFAKDLVALPEKLRRKQLEGKRQKGMTALTRGLEAVAAGDADSAQRHARSAQALLEERGLTRLLSAQAAQLAGDDATAQTAFTAMLEAPETEFLGLRGLYGQATRKGDLALAKSYAERAFRLRPGAAWAFDSVYRLYLERGAWGDAKNTLDMAGRQGKSKDAGFRRREAALLTAQAYASQAYASQNNHEEQLAMKEAEAALKLQPDFTPAAVFVAKHHLANGKTGKAFKVIENAWKKRPHPALARLAVEALTEKTPEERANRITALAALNPDHEESQMLLATLAIEKKDWQAAQAQLQPLLELDPKARTFRAMATVMENLYGKEQMMPWLEKALHAPPDMTIGADGDFHLSTQGWQRLVEEYGTYDRLTPPPIEQICAAMNQEEIQKLIAPPQREAPSETPPSSPLSPDTPESKTIKTEETEGAATPAEDAVLTEPPHPDWVEGSENEDDDEAVKLN